MKTLKGFCFTAIFCLIGSMLGSYPAFTSEQLCRFQESIEGLHWEPYPKAYMVDGRKIFIYGVGVSYFAVDVTASNAPYFLWKTSNQYNSGEGILFLDGMSSPFDVGEIIEGSGGGSATVLGMIGTHAVVYYRRSGDFQVGHSVAGQDSDGIITALSHTSVIIPELGQAWSEPQFGLVKTSDEDTTGTPVFFIGGGYSPGNSSGKMVLVVEVLTGEVLVEFKDGMGYCFPSAVTVVDSDGNGFIDKFYVGDFGGQMWRFGNFSDATGNLLGFPKCNENVMSWTGSVIFCANENDEKRKFFSPPSVVLEKGYDLLFMGTGDREDVCNPDSSDRIYCVKDDHSLAGLTEEDLVDVLTPVTIGGQEVLPLPRLQDASADVDRNDLPDRGWFLSLTSGEKVLQKGLVFNRVFYISTFKPVGTDGEGTLYALDYKTGKPVVFVDEENHRVWRRWVGESIPSKPVMVIDQSVAKLLVSTSTSDSENFGSGILALDPIMPSSNFYSLWWKEL
jgi:hypothetical protein